MNIPLWEKDIREVSEVNGLNKQETDRLIERIDKLIDLAVKYSEENKTTI